MAAAVLVAASGIVVASALWGYAWLRLGGERIAVLDEEVGAAGGHGTSSPGSTTVLVALTEPSDPTVRDTPPLAAGVALVQVGGPRDGAVVLVLPRDLPIGGHRTLADVQVTGGIDALVRAAIDYTGVAVDHAVSATTDALPALVDLRGTVELCTASGCRDLTGDAVGVAVAQADDVDRVRTVAAVLRSLAAGFDHRSALLSPVTTKRTVDVVADLVVTDVELRGTGLLDVASALTDGAELEVVTLPSLRDPSSGEVLVLPERAEVVFQHLREGTPIGSLALDDEPLAVGGVSVAVLNGAGVQGLAARVESRLEAEGFTVVGTGNAPPFGLERTVVAYAPDNDAVRIAAIVLVERLGLGELEALPSAPRFEGEPVDLLVTAGLDLDEQE